MHPQLLRQLRRAYGAPEAVPADVQPLLELIDQAYREGDEDRLMIERSLEGISEELNARNGELARQLGEVRRQARILENIHDAVFAFDGNGIVTSVNEATARLFGVPLDQVQGRPAEQFVRPRDGQPSITPLIESVARTGRWVGDLGIVRPDGSECIAETTLVSLPGEHGADAGFIAVGRDVTEKRLMERQLFQSQKLEAIGQLAAGVAHEINTPAQYVADNLRFLLDGFQQLLGAAHAAVPAAAPTTASAVAPPLDADTLSMLEQEVPSAIQQSLDGMERIAEIVRGVKTFGHPGGGHKTLVDLNAEIESTIAVSRNEWKYVAEMETDFDPDLPPVPAFAGEINHVFLNIFVNAAHAIGDVNRGGQEGKGRIHVATRHDGDWIEVRIRDTGGGIPEAIRGRVFDPFFTTKAVGKGTGQGLAISHRLVEEKHGGTIRFDSVCGKGTTFIIRLPLGAADAMAIKEAA